MSKKTIRLTESEFRAVVKHALNEALSEIDGATYARIHNSTMQAQKNQLAGVPSKNPRKNNIDTILHGISLDPRAADSLITPYKTKYTFHCKNLRGAAALTIFELQELYCLDNDKAILKGNITFNGEQLHGSIIVDMATHNVVYNYKGKSPRYQLTIDPSNKQQWDALVNQLAQSLKARTI